ncbi:hypothetical protein R69927_06803 [Paraburkholderia domus]|nr:hypothetical protein R69749_01109 [Paraburkholderia domus]CAE6837857.1 hypothetical protein R70006_06963 [Paraburkholderia domus]CAE6925275.1 hypothetical protein R69927_06803 [Paraburkholderia domus]CAE6948058.1 hypothetical protein R70199_06476 [Paraburkholderia domus]
MASQSGEFGATCSRVEAAISKCSFSLTFAEIHWGFFQIGMAGIALIVRDTVSRATVRWCPIPKPARNVNKKPTRTYLRSISPSPRQWLIFRNSSSAQRNLTILGAEIERLILADAANMPHVCEHECSLRHRFQSFDATMPSSLPGRTRSDDERPRSTHYRRSSCHGVQWQLSKSNGHFPEGSQYAPRDVGFHSESLRRLVDRHGDGFESATRVFSPPLRSMEHLRQS